MSETKANKLAVRVPPKGRYKQYWSIAGERHVRQYWVDGVTVLQSVASYVGGWSVIVPGVVNTLMLETEIGALTVLEMVEASLVAGVGQFIEVGLPRGRGGVPIA